MYLQGTLRCGVFSDLAEHVWNKIIYSHEVHLDEDERGITRHLTTVLRHNNNIGLWSNPGFREYENGSDIDVFVETGINEFIWFALQAKLLKVNHKYDGVDKKTNGIYQWDMLKTLSQNTGCLSMYLFYNGFKNKNLGTYTDCCKLDFSETQFGCSIVEVDNVINVCSLNNPPSYSDFHPKLAHPWREMVCCIARRKSNTRFSIRQIENSVSYYEPLINESVITFQNQAKVLDEDIGLIDKQNELVNRVSEFRFIVRTSAGLKAK